MLAQGLTHQSKRSARAWRSGSRAAVAIGVPGPPAPISRPHSNTGQRRAYGARSQRLGIRTNTGNPVAANSLARCRQETRMRQQEHTDWVPTRSATHHLMQPEQSIPHVIGPVLLTGGIAGTASLTLGAQQTKVSVSPRRENIHRVEPVSRGHPQGSDRNSPANHCARYGVLIVLHRVHAVTRPALDPYEMVATQTGRVCPIVDPLLDPNAIEKLGQLVDVLGGLAGHPDRGVLDGVAMVLYRTLLRSNMASIM